MKEKFTKAEVKFEHPAKGMDQCRACKHFEVEEKNGCAIVEGFIRPEDWCTEFKRKTK